MCSTLARLEKLVSSRLSARPPGSYTAALAARGTAYVARKVGEEAVELAVEAARGDRRRVVEEAADLLYHLVVLLRMLGLSLRDVEAELEARMRGEGRGR